MAETGDNGHKGHNTVATGSRNGGAVGTPALDDLDLGIVDMLQRNGRESIRNVAQAIGVSEATVRKRYAALVAADAIRVTAIANPSKLGYEAMAMLAISTTGRADAVANEVASWPESSHVVVTAGHHDVIVEVVCEDRQHLLELINRIRAVDDVTATETFVYLELVKRNQDWRLRRD